MAPRRLAPFSKPDTWAPMPVPHRKRAGPLMLWMMYLLACLGVVPLLQYLAIPHVPPLQQFQALLILFLCTIPVVLHLTKKDAGLPVFPIICLVYAMSYALPVFFVKPVVVAMSTITGTSTLAKSDVTEALWLTLMGVVAMQLGFWFFQYSILHLVIPKVRLPLQKAPAQRLVSILGLLGLFLLWTGVTNRLVIPISIFYITVLITKQAALCIALLYFYYLNGDLTSRMKMWFISLILMMEMIGFATGNLRNVMDPFVVIGAVYWMVRKKFPWKYAVVGVLIFMIIQPIKAVYRMKVWGEGYATNSVTDRLALWGELVQLSWSGAAIPGTAATQLTTRNTLVRTDLIHTFARVVELTPRQVPYQLGQTYNYLLYALIPRALWPGKPTGQSVNQFFGVSYDFQNEESLNDTSIGCPHLPEAYLNFGPLGVIFVMMIIGMIYGAVDRLFNHPDAGEGGIAVYAVILTDLWTIETATAPTFGGLIQGLLVYTLILRLVQEKKKKNQEPPFLSKPMLKAI
jgi:hypothetical protein